MSINLSYPLFNAAFLDLRTGHISRPWQQWLTALWNRVGEGNAPSLDEIATAIEAEYLVAVANPQLTNERVVINTATVSWDFTITGQARANVDLEAIQDTIGGMFVDTATVDFTYDDAGNALTAQIPDDAVTYAKLQNVTAASRLLGRGSAGGPGDPEEITLGSGLAMAGTVLSATSSVRWEPLATGDIANSATLCDITECDPFNDLVYANGDVIMVEVPA